jgi:hypothetical protein
MPGPDRATAVRVCDFRLDPFIFGRGFAAAMQ